MPDLEIPCRRELKYVIPEWRVDEVRAAIQPFCVLDEHCARHGERSYVVTSIYFDTWVRDLFRVARERRPRRLKLRARTYGDEPGGPVFLEVKRKERDVVRKTRGRVSAEWAERLRGRAPADASPGELAFRDELTRLSGEPALLVRYEREAWHSEIDAYARVTFDRRITVQEWTRPEFGDAAAGWMAVDDPATLRAGPRSVVLELKCPLEVPRWMSGLAERLGLQRVGLSKYCIGVERVWGRTAPLRAAY